MSISLKFRSTENEKPANINLQFIPARTHTKLEEETKINHFLGKYSDNSDADVEQTPSTSTEIETPIENSLRGYPIVGTEVQIPSTHHGFVFQEDKQPLAESAHRTFNQNCHFDKFTYYNYDQTPSANDSVKKAIESFCMTEELHETVDPDELNEFIKKSIDQS